MSIVHQENKNTGVVYVYESESYWDKEKKQSRSRRRCIGKLEPATGNIIPSKKYLAEKELESLKKRGPVPSVESKRLFYGATYLFEQISDKLGIAPDLELCFGEKAQKIMSLAYYLILEENNAMSRFTKWGKTHFHPYGRDFPSQRISELFASIDENAKQEFFKRQGSRRDENEFLVYDSTSISSYSKLIKQVKWGNNKDDDLLAQINLALIYSQSLRLPVYYRKLPGNIADVTTINKLIKDIEFLEIGKFMLIMDRGFFSIANINALYENHYKFLIGAKIGLSFIQRELDLVRETMKSRAFYSSDLEVHFYTKTINWHYQGKKKNGEVVNADKRMYLHLFYNHQRVAEDQTAFNKKMDQLEEELLSGKRVKDNEKQYEKYYHINNTPKKGIKLIPKQDVMDKAQKNYGFYAFVSNKEKDPLAALQIYRSKDIIEKAFENLKERLNAKRANVSSEESLDGKLFVQFVALMIVAYIDKVMRDNSLYKKYTLQGLLDEIDIIERFERPGKKHHIGEITKKQSLIYEAMKVDPLK